MSKNAERIAPQSTDQRKAQPFRRFDAGVQLTAGYRLPSRLTVAAEADLGCTPVATGRKAAATLSLMFTYTF